MAVYTYDTLREVRLNIGDRTEPYHWSDEELAVFLDRASGNINGGTAYCLQAWATEEGRAWTSATVGSVSRSKTNPADALMKAAAQYAAQSSGTAVLDPTRRPAFGTARSDWAEHAAEDSTEIPVVVDAYRQRIRSEELED